MTTPSLRGSTLSMNTSDADSDAVSNMVRATVSIGAGEVDGKSGFGSRGECGVEVGVCGGGCNGFGGCGDMEGVDGGTRGIALSLSIGRADGGLAGERATSSCGGTSGGRLTEVI